MKRSPIQLGLILIAIAIAALLANRHHTTPPAPAQSGDPSYTQQARTKTSGCQPSNGLQDTACTPGATNPSLTQAILCSSSFSTKTVRNVPSQEKAQVYGEYGIASHSPGQYEVDHLISLELGGSNDIANLWPEAAEPRPGFHEKDLVENYLHKQMCSGAISLTTAQQEISQNWLGVYNSVPDIQNYR